MKLAPPIAKPRSGALISRVFRVAALLLGLGWSCRGVNRAFADEIRGVDASFVPQIESLGGVFRAGGVPVDPIVFFASQGVTTVRLRVWNNPPAGFCDVGDTLALAQRVHAQGMKLWIDFHYSDAWADPGQQNKPGAWSGLGVGPLAIAVQSFTRNTIAALVAQGTPPDIVQIGNEITSGFLWSEGWISAWNDANWVSFATLLNAGASGARLGAGPHPIRVMLHIDRGGDNATTREFFDRAARFGVSFDLIGLSYYPWWHGSIEALDANVRDAAERFAKPVVVAETAYPWTLQWFDSQNNFVWNASQLLPAYPATAGGQASFLQSVSSLLRAVPQGRGAGFCYWAPEYGPFPGLPSPWENLALFDFAGEALGSWEAFRAPCAGDLNADGMVDDADFVIFAEAYNLLDCADPSMPAGCPADLSRDAFVDDADFIAFAEAYNALLCP